MTTSVLEQDLLIRAEARREALTDHMAEQWMAVEYRKALNGGFRRENGTYTDRPHIPAIKFHEACKDPLHQIFFIGGGRRSSKTFTAITEFCAWIKGERPWDGSPTCPPGSGRRWLMCAPNFSTHFPDVICPYFEQRMGDWIVDVVRNQQKVPVTYILKNGDTVRNNSYEQFLKVGHDWTTVFESGAYAGALFDERPPRPVWLGVKRGLVTGQSAWGWGKAIIGATPEHAAWLFDEIYSQSHVKGGSERSIWAGEFSIYDNPGNTPEAIAQMEQGLSQEEREAIIYGRFRHLTGRVFSEFEDWLHVYDASIWDPLLTPEGDPSSWPVAMACDPHSRRPPFLSWCVVGPGPTFWFVREHPLEPYGPMRNSHIGFDELAELIYDVEKTIPGGSERVLYRELDPNFGRIPSLGSKGRTTQEELQSRGLYFRTDANNRIPDGHRHLHTLLRYDPEQPLSAMNRPHLFVEQSLRNMRWAFESYTFDDHSNPDKAPKETPKDNGKDPIDTARYIVMRKPESIPWMGRSQANERRRSRTRSRMRSSRW